MKLIFIVLITFIQVAAHAEDYHLDIQYSEYYNFTVYINKSVAFKNTDNAGHGVKKIDVTDKVYQGSNQVKVCYVPRDMGNQKPNLKNIAKITLQKDSQKAMKNFRTPASEKYLAYSLGPHGENFIAGVESCFANRFDAFDINLAAAPIDDPAIGTPSTLELSDQLIKEMEDPASANASIPQPPSANPIKYDTRDLASEALPSPPTIPSNTEAAQASPPEPVEVMDDVNEFPDNIPMPPEPPPN